MKPTTSLLALVAALGFAGGALAQPSGSHGSDAKGNAPVKAPHTVNDGAARRGANSFTEGQARQHILNSGYSSISTLTKGSDGVWRGTATKDGAAQKVALDFKGNVTTEGPADVPATGEGNGGKAVRGAQPSGAGMAPEAPSPAAASVAARGHHARHHHRHWRAHHRHRHHGHARCANPGVNGTACSGVDRNHNGVSDKEDRAISKGARP